MYVIDHCNRIIDTIEGLDKQEFLNSRDVQDIVCFNLLQIGELAKSFSKSFLEEYPLVPWPQIKGLRDRIVHGYGDIKMERIWKTAVEDIKPLSNYCESILEENA